MEEINENREEHEKKPFDGGEKDNKEKIVGLKSEIFKYSLSNLKVSFT